GIRVTIYPESNMLNSHKYKEELWTCVKPLLEVYGLDENELRTFENEMVKIQKDISVILIMLVFPVDYIKLH
ncbi:MAG: hypothetical protein WBE34_01870, partial [Candidatus Nitrosopolaris sp.]